MIRSDQIQMIQIYAIEDGNDPMSYDSLSLDHDDGCDDDDDSADGGPSFLCDRFHAARNQGPTFLF